MTGAECARLIEHAAPRLARSKTLGDVVSEVRTSEQAWLAVSDATVGDIVVKVRARAAQLTGVLRPELFGKCGKCLSPTTCGSPTGRWAHETNRTPNASRERARGPPSRSPRMCFPRRRTLA